MVVNRAVGPTRNRRPSLRGWRRPAGFGGFDCSHCPSRGSSAPQTAAVCTTPTGYGFDVRHAPTGSASEVTGAEVQEFVTFTQTYEGKQYTPKELSAKLLAAQRGAKAGSIWKRIRIRLG
jgi:hypothetical protein